MTERKTIERLTRDILDADEYHACTQKSAKSIAAKLVSVGWQPSVVHQCCEDAVNYRPRVVESVEELDELPDLTVVIDSHQDVSQKRGGLWCSYETAPMTSRQLSKYGSITLLHAPPAPHVEAGPVTFGDDGFEVSV